MQSLSFITLWPGGNPTLLIDLRNTNQRLNLREVASQLLTGPYPKCEQVGFLFKPTQTGTVGRLMMMGGELCINAMRCAARIFAGDNKEFLFEASGLSYPVLGHVSGDVTTISFLAPLEIKKLADGVHFVGMPGIGHFVRPSGPEVGREELQRLIDTTPAAAQYSAVGLIARHARERQLAIIPLVHVQATDSWIFESACGSGSLAAVAVSREDGLFEVTQPSGDILSITWRAPYAIFCGPVVKIAVGVIYLPLLPVVAKAVITC